MDESLAFAGVARQAELIRSGEVSSRELVELYLERIARIQPELNAFRLLMPERALADADQADARRGAGEERPLLGVPMAIKDNQDVAGEITAHGTAAHGGPAAEDSEIVRRLRVAGAVIVGKTNVPELAIIGDTEGPAFGVTRNPWNTDRSAGGSSGGSAAAVAAGLVAAATASDGGGSIRIPACNCGVFGLKPQRGRVSLMPDAEHWHGLSVCGFETRFVRDTALLLDVVAGAADGDAHTPPPPESPYVEAASRPPGELRIAVSARPLLPAVVDRQVRRVLDDTAELLRSLGHRVERANPRFGTMGNAATARFLNGIAAESRTLPRPERLQRRSRGFVRLGSLFPDSAVRTAVERSAADYERIGIFEDYDVLLTPVAVRPPVRAGRWEGLGALRTVLSMSSTYPFCIPWNHTGQPAASIPAGTSDDGLPIGMQLVGRPNAEGTLLSLSAQIEAERPWADRLPPVS
ncbi:MAG TPA: amidase [Thermoleophilaceae bacterium]|jgi:amidase